MTLQRWFSVIHCGRQELLEIVVLIVVGRKVLANKVKEIRQAKPSVKQLAPANESR